MRVRELQGRPGAWRHLREQRAVLVDDVIGAITRARHRTYLAPAGAAAGLRPYHSLDLDDLFPSSPDVPWVAVRPGWVRDGLEGYSLAFRSAHRPVCPDLEQRSRQGCGANDTVHVRWVRHPEGAARSTLILLHSWLQPWTRLEDRWLLPRLADRLGVDVARMTLPYHGHRKPRASVYDGEFFWSGDLVRSVEAFRQSVTDVRTLLSWLEKHTGRPVGICGISLGGMVALATAGVEPRASVVVPIAAHLDLASILDEASLLAKVRADLERAGSSTREIAVDLQCMGFDGIQPLVAPERMLFVAGRYDRFLRPERIEALRQRWGVAAIDWYDGGHLGMLGYLAGDLTRLRDLLSSLGLAGSV